MVLLLLLWKFSFCQSQKENWNYPIRPGSKEWLSKPNFAERLSLLNLPMDTINKLETDRLVNICLEYLNKNYDNLKH